MTLPDTGKQRFHLREFKTLNTLGEGRYAKVMLAVTSVDHHLGVPAQGDGRFLYAIKVINTKFDKPALNFKNANSLAKIKNEVKIMSILSKTDHKNVLKLYSIVNNESTAEVEFSEEMGKKHHKIYLIMGFCSLGELTLENFQQDRPSLGGSLQKMRDIVLGVEFLHRQGIVHRDVKPSNLLIDPSGVVKLSDFGISYKLTGDEKSDSFELGTPCGTPLFLPPELCGYGSHQLHCLGSVQYGTKIDVWALGVTFFYLFWGSFPFFDDNKFKLFQDISKSPLEFPSFDNAYFYRNFTTSGCSDKELKSLFLQVKSLVSAMLVKDLAQRFSIQQVKKHKLFSNEISKSAYEKDFIQYNDGILPEDSFHELKKPGLKDTFSKLFVSRRASKHKPKVDVASISQPVAGSFKHVTAKPSFASDLNTTTSTIPSSMSSFVPGDENDDYSEAHEIGKFSSQSSLFLLQPFPRILPTENASSTSLPVAQRPSFSTERPPRSSPAAAAATTKRESVNTLPSQFSDITPNLSSVPGRFESPESIPSTTSSLRHGLVRSKPTRNLSDLALSSAAGEGIPEHKKHNFISMGDYLDSLA